MSSPESGAASSPGRIPAAPKKKRAPKPSYEKIDPAIPILLAEKSPLHLPKIKQIFADFYLSNITITGDGYRAISYGKEKKYGLIIVGQTLTNVDGINVIEGIRGEGENTETPIIFLWEGVEETLLDHASSSGASGSLKKPVDEAPFRELFEKHLHRYIVSYDDERERAHEAMKPMVQAAEFAQNVRLQGDYEAAEAAYENGLLQLFCGLAELYLSRGDASFANRILTQAEKLDPSARTRFGIREEAFIERGKNYLEKKWTDGAQVEFEAALTLNETSIPALIGLGDALLSRGKTEKATEAFERAIEAKVMPEDRVLFNRFGTLALRNKDFNVALRAFDKAISYFPQEALSYYNKALLFVLQKNWDKAGPLLRKATMLNPGFAEATTMLQKVERWKKILTPASAEQA